MGLFFQQCLADHLHLTSGDKRWTFCNSDLLFESGTDHPSIIFRVCVSLALVGCLDYILNVSSMFAHIMWK